MANALSGLIERLRDLGAEFVLVKELAENDNSKNQIYLGSNFEILNLLPLGEIEVDSSVAAGSKRERNKAALDFWWLTGGGLSRAPRAKLIMYPRYPEVRLSAVLQNSHEAPADLINPRLAGRLLFLAPTEGGKVFAHVVAPDSPIVKEFHAVEHDDRVGVFTRLQVRTHTNDTKSLLLDRLRDVYLQGPLPGQRLQSDGTLVPYSARNAGGTTLEAVLGISANSRAEPDLYGWEIKQYGTTGPPRYRAKSAITLMTPEPTGGVYRDEGVDSFIHRYGYPDTRGTVDRRNFGGVYGIGKSPHQRTGLKLQLCQSPSNDDGISLVGSLQLVDEAGNVAADWRLADLLAHWNKKHAQAAYVPSTKLNKPASYAYGPTVLLCEGTDFLLFMEELAKGNIVLDPALNRTVQRGVVRIHTRNQFRVKFTGLSQLYHFSEIVQVVKSETNP